MHRVVGRAADPDADDPGRARLPAGADDRLEHELLDPLHAVGGDAHLQEAHVLRARSLRDALDVEPVPVGDEVPVDDRDAVADVRARVLARQRVDGVRAQRVVERRAHRPVVERLVDPRRVEREVLADAAVVDGDPGVLADEVVLALRHLDVLEDRLEDALPGDRRLLAGRVRERVAQVLRDVLQRPDVEVRRGILDRLLDVGLDRAHAGTLPSISAHRSAIASGSTGSRPKSTSSLDDHSATSNSPPAAPEHPAGERAALGGQEEDARNDLLRRRARPAPPNGEACASPQQERPRSRRMPCGLALSRPRRSSTRSAPSSRPRRRRARDACAPTAIARPEVVKTKPSVLLLAS